MTNSPLAETAGFEPATLRLVGDRSIQTGLRPSRWYQDRGSREGAPIRFVTHAVWRRFATTSSIIANAVHNM